MPASAEEIDQLLKSMEASVIKIDVAQGSIVKLPKAELDFLVHVEHLRDAIADILKSGDRDILKSIFGGDCVRTARLSTTLSAVRLSEMNANDQRLHTCQNSCQAVVDVLNDMDLGFVLEQALTRQKSQLQHERIDVLMDANKESAVLRDLWDEVAAPLGHGHAVPDSGGSEDMWGAVAQKVDDCDDIEDEEELQLVDEDSSLTISSSFDVTVQNLFTGLDKDGDGLVSMAELKYGIKRSKAMRSVLGLFTFAQCTRFLNIADVDGSGNLDFEEFKTFLKEREAALNKQAQEAAEKTLADNDIDPKILEEVFNEVDTDQDGLVAYVDLALAYGVISMKLGKRIDRRKIMRWVAKELREHGEQGDSFDLAQFRDMAMASIFAYYFEG